MTDRDWILRLDRDRHADPKRVNKLLEDALKTVEAELVPSALLVYGATFRQLGRFRDARWAYFEGADLAKAARNLGLQAEFRQRRSWVEFQDGKFNLATDLLRMACGTFCEIGDKNREGKVLVDFGLQYNTRRMFREALAPAAAALEKLSPGEHENFFGAYQVLAYGNQALGNSVEALEALRKARAAVQNCCKAQRIRFLWMEARMKKDLVSLESAAQTFSEAATFFMENGELLDAAIATLEFAKCKADLGEHKEVQSITRRLKALAFKAEGAFFVGVLLELYREGLRGKITDSLLQCAINELSTQRTAEPRQT